MATSDNSKFVYTQVTLLLTVKIIITIKQNVQ